jgi:pyruvate formate lyase activating enzyme
MAIDNPTSQPEPSAAIWKIDRFAIHDGPGIRTNVYFKGCPLRCLWCSNPEGQMSHDQLGLLAAKCTGCGRCFDVCAPGALEAVDGRPAVDFAACDVCGDCVPVCAPGALFVYGGTYTLSQLMDIVERDRHVYRRSGGGITLTGGEPLLQHDFAQQLLGACHKVGIHTVVETCGCIGSPVFLESLREIDWLFFDLKHIDPVEHRRLTGRSNDMILENLRTASSFFREKDRKLVLRQVVVPGLNDGENITALARLAAGLPRVDMIELLPCHNYGTDKYATLGWSLPEELVVPSVELLDKYRDTIEGYGVPCRIGGL